MSVHVRPGSLVCLLLVICLSVGLVAGASDATPMLVRIDVESPLAELGIPIRAHLQDATGQDYVLAIASSSELTAAGLVPRYLDTAAGVPGYLIALERRPGARSAAARLCTVLHDDGRRIIVRWTEGLEDQLAALGLDLARLSDTPLVLRTPPPTPAALQVDYDPVVDGMISQVTQAMVYGYTGDLSGENPVDIGGSPYTIATRHTGSGTPIDKATQLVYERMQSKGLNVSYHDWSYGGYSNRNVIGAKLGTALQDEIVLITAHLDDMPSGPLAPGADDNGSGSVAVQIAADILSQHFFKRTIRFVFFTGEEQGLLGSDQYAAAVATAGDAIVSVYNMDMIAWDGSGGPDLRLITRTTGNPGYAGDLAIATVFSDVVSTYGLSGNLTPIIHASGTSASDHSSFWDIGCSAILAIEDTVNDFNPYYHTVDDTRANMNMDYFVNYVKASVGTAAHLAELSIAGCQENCIHPVSAAITEMTGNGNGVAEWGEKIRFSPTWTNTAGYTYHSVTGLVAEPDDVWLLSDDASYGTFPPGATYSCEGSGDCYVMIVNGTRPQLHWDVALEETLSTGETITWLMHIGGSFADIPVDHWAYSFIETILHHGITSGCGNQEYCPGMDVSRWQMAVFIAQAMVGDDEVPASGTVPDKGAYTCGAGGTSVFADIPPEDGGCKFIHYLASQGITGGCSATEYCPDWTVDRWQMGVFLAEAMVGDGTVPTSGTVPDMGSYSCEPGGVSVFSDLPADDPACAHIHYLAAEGVTGGCGNGQYCPASPVLRGQMAVFLTTAFDLQLY